MATLAFVGCVALLFGLGSYYGTQHLGIFGGINLAAGGAALLAALVAGLRRLGRAGGPYARRLIARGLLGIAGALVLGIAAERTAHWSGLRGDWTLERRYELSPPLADLLRQVPGLRITLFYDPLDPRI